MEKGIIYLFTLVAKVDALVTVGALSRERWLTF
jgi:hypothetical protein